MNQQAAWHTSSQLIRLPSSLTQLTFKSLLWWGWLGVGISLPWLQVLSFSQVFSVHSYHPGTHLWGNILCSQIWRPQGPWLQLYSVTCISSIFGPWRWLFCFLSPNMFLDFHFIHFISCCVFGIEEMCQKFEHSKSSWLEIPRHIFYVIDLENKSGDSRISLLFAFGNILMKYYMIQHSQSLSVVTYLHLFFFDVEYCQKFTELGVRKP